ncbi:hypothetical protein G9A89_022891 [Geosiphon pyriformis]|nr:hypothetical protein G9A89_022891 [Geosiphon pyriformis]
MSAVQPFFESKKSPNKRSCTEPSEQDLSCTFKKKLKKQVESTYTSSENNVGLDYDSCSFSVNEASLSPDEERIEISTSEIKLTSQVNLDDRTNDAASITDLQTVNLLAVSQNTRKHLTACHPNNFKQSESSLLPQHLFSDESKNLDILSDLPLTSSECADSFSSEAERDHSFKTSKILDSQQKQSAEESQNFFGFRTSSGKSVGIVSPSKIAKAKSLISHILVDPSEENVSGTDDFLTLDDIKKSTLNVFDDLLSPHLKAPDSDLMSNDLPAESLNDSKNPRSISVAQTFGLQQLLSASDLKINSNFESEPSFTNFSRFSTGSGKPVGPVSTVRLNQAKSLLSNLNFEPDSNFQVTPPSAVLSQFSPARLNQAKSLFSDLNFKSDSNFLVTPPSTISSQFSTGSGRSVGLISPARLNQAKYLFSDLNFEPDSNFQATPPSTVSSQFSTGSGRSVGPISSARFNQAKSLFSDLNFEQNSNFLVTPPSTVSSQFSTGSGRLVGPISSDRLNQAKSLFSDINLESDSNLEVTPQFTNFAQLSNHDRSPTSSSLEGFQRN